MLNDFLIFVAPFLVIVAAIIVVFWISPKDESVTKEQ